MHILCHRVGVGGLTNDDAPNKKCYFPIQVDDMGRGGQKVQFFYDVICERSLKEVPRQGVYGPRFWSILRCGLRFLMTFLCGLRF